MISTWRSMTCCSSLSCLSISCFSLRSFLRFFYYLALCMRSASSIPCVSFLELMKSTIKLQVKRQQQSGMSDNLQVVECFYGFSGVYSIHDYTKIAYPIDSFICTRELSNSAAKPTFIRIQHEYLRVMSLHSLLGHIYTVEQLNDNEFGVCHYDVVQTLVKLHPELTRPTPRLDTLFAQEWVMVGFLHGSDNELILFSLKKMKVITKCFITGPILEMQVRNAECFSILFEDGRIAIYTIEEAKVDDNLPYSLKISEQKVLKHKTFVKHCWSKDDLVTLDFQGKMEIYFNHKAMQQFNSTYNVESVEELRPTVNGFIIVSANCFTVYKKPDVEYESIRQLHLTADTKIRGLMLSPQQELLVVLDVNYQQLLYCQNFQQCLDPSVKEEDIEIKTIAFGQNCENVESATHLSKESEMSIYCAKDQSFFFSVSADTLHIYSSVTFDRYLTVGIEFFDKGQADKKQEILCVDIHPVQPLVAVSLRSKVRMYQILYGQLRWIRDIHLNSCKSIGFNNSGSFFYLAIQGKQGAKIYLHRTSDCQLIETLNVGKRIVKYCWGRYDNYFYAVHQAGYFSWNIESFFKTRYDSDIEVPFKVSKVLVDSKNRLLLYDRNNIMVVSKHEIEFQTSCSKGLHSVLVQDESYLFVTASGEIYVSREVDNNIFSRSPFRLFNSPNRTMKVECYSIRDNMILCLLESNNIMFLRTAKASKAPTPTEIVGIERHKINAILKQYKTYESTLSVMRDKYEGVVYEIKEDFNHQVSSKMNEFESLFSEKKEELEQIKTQKSQLEFNMDNYVKNFQTKTMIDLHDLEKLYDRKIAIITNKHLTTEEINFRNKVLAERKLKELEIIHDSNIDQIRQQYSCNIVKTALEKDHIKEEIEEMKKIYDTRLYELEQENELLLQRIQDNNHLQEHTLKKKLVNWENKFLIEKSQKDNLDKDKQALQQDKHQLVEVLAHQKQRNEEQQRKNAKLQADLARMEMMIEQKNDLMKASYVKISDLEKSNQVLKYRVMELKNQHDPQEEEITRLKDNLLHLEQEYDCINQNTREKCLVLEVTQKQNKKQKDLLKSLSTKLKNLEKTHQDLINQVRDTSKASSQDVRKQLFNIIKGFDGSQSTPTKAAKIDNTVEELNRMREHLEASLNEAFESNKKCDQQKKVQLLKKNRQNSDLLKQLNELRKRIKQLQTVVQSKDAEVKRLSRKEVNPEMTIPDTELKCKSKNKTRETFFEKSLFKTGWKEKRLKTEQTGGGNRRKISSYSINRHDHTTYLAVEAGGHTEEIDEYRRILDQKQTIIKQLINKIQALS